MDLCCSQGISLNEVVLGRLLFNGARYVIQVCRRETTETLSTAAMSRLRKAKESRFDDLVDFRAKSLSVP